MSDSGLTKSLLSIVDLLFLSLLMQLNQLVLIEENMLNKHAKIWEYKNIRTQIAQVTSIFTRCSIAAASPGRSCMCHKHVTVGCVCVGPLRAPGVSVVISICSTLYRQMQPY